MVVWPKTDLIPWNLAHETESEVERKGGISASSIKLDRWRTFKEFACSTSHEQPPASDSFPKTAQIIEQNCLVYSLV